MTWTDTGFHGGLGTETWGIRQNTVAHDSMLLWRCDFPLVKSGCRAKADL
jgi:hypothetical protein